jgi:hypothetical protein
MGEAKRKLSTTQKMVLEFPRCYFCGGLRASETREHMPPKSLFDDSHRPEKLVMPACRKCNAGTSSADLTAAIVSRWGYDINEKGLNDHRRLLFQVRKQNPELVEEWINSTGVYRKKMRAHLRNHGVPVPYDAGVAIIGAHTIRQLNLFAHKAVLALYFEHFRQPLPASGRLIAFWKTKEDFAKDGIPSFLLEMMPGYNNKIRYQRVRRTICLSS